MLLGRPRLSVALDAGSVWGVLVRRGLRRASLIDAAGVQLPAAALVPSPLERNIQRGDEVAAAVRSVCARLGAGGQQGVDLILPAGVMRPQILDARGPERDPEARRFRLVASLPYAASEAVIGTIRLPRRRLLAAAVRRTVVAEYEALARDAGLAPRRVELAPLLACAALVERPLPARAVDVVLGDAAVSLVSWDGDSPAGVRTRLRILARDDAAWLLREIERATRTDSGAGFAATRLAGAGAGALARRLREMGREARLAWDLPEAPSGMEPAELSWLGGVLR